MNEKYVMDACALIAFLRDETGADAVTACFMICMVCTLTAQTRVSKSITFTL